MDRKEFWEIIGLGNLTYEDTSNVDIIITKLASYSEEDIIGFEIIFRQLLDEADDFGIVAIQKIIFGIVSDDSYLYFRCWLIAQGKDFFNKCLANGDSIVERLQNEQLPSFEDILYISTESFKRKTEIDFEDEQFPRSVALSKGYDYDFNSPRTKGKKIKMSDLPKKFPQLWSLCRTNPPHGSVFEMFSKAGFYDIPYLS
jgi:hypothetical protein